ncbi:hypothetical protein I4U23_013236 [Adineta vaga]|nr:hypothetical protein I4U23_013236 [Adineta vaga]
MATAIEQLVIDPQSRFLEMKSLQPYSTTDEYLYAMKEDLADWLSNMYPDWGLITADNFLERLENGALLCHHANNVNDAARKMSSTTSSLINCKYRTDARPQTFNARDNVSQFIKWARRVAGVREVLMFESDDLILRKNEKNFLLCLLEIARFGAKFGVSVPAIIKLEDEIEREIARDKQQTELNSSIEFKNSQRKEIQEYHVEKTEKEEEQEEIPRTKLDTTNYQSVVNDNNDNDDQNSSNTFSVSSSNGANWLQAQLTHTSIFSNNNYDNTDSTNSKNKQTTEENYDSITSNEITTPMITANDDLPFSQTSSNEQNHPNEPPACSSHLHKTVIQIVNSCCCSDRFPVIRIGEGKYRIGENGTIIFIRILRNHVMVRVGGGWDTLENYLNKHDPCRRSGAHRRSEHHQHHNHSDIPILALGNPNISPSTQKTIPYGKSVTIKTEEFPLPKPSQHDTNLVDAQLVITRDADGRHRIGQITYRSEEDILNQPASCPHHHHHRSSPTTKMRNNRVTGRLTPSSIYSKQSSPSTDQDYSSFTETTPSKPSSSSSLDSKDDSLEHSIKSLNITLNEKQSPRHYSPIIKSHTQPLNLNDTNHFNEQKSRFTESIIGNIDDHMYSTSLAASSDFDINDIDDIMSVKKKSVDEKDQTNMDNDSLESSEGILEEKKRSVPSPRISSTTRKSTISTSSIKSSTEKQATNRLRPAFNRYSTRSNTVSNIVDAVKKEEQQLTKPRRKPVIATQRSQSSDLVDKTNDVSKLDRDSGFDEQDFRRERLHSIGDDNSSISSMRSAKSSTPRLSTIEYKENKSYELRMKKLEANRVSTEKLRPNLHSASRRTSDLIPPIPPIQRYRKNSQPIINSKQQQ